MVIRAVTIMLLVFTTAVLDAAPPGPPRRSDPRPAASVTRPVGGVVTRPFDPPPHPYGPGHRGVDLAASSGEPARAALDGTVTFAGTVAHTGWVTVDHGGGLATTYGDLVPAVQSGRAVVAGEVLGHLAPAATHLDWGARLDGVYIDPLGLLGRWRAHLAHPSTVPTGLRQPV